MFCIYLSSLFILSQIQYILVSYSWDPDQILSTLIFDLDPNCVDALINVLMGKNSGTKSFHTIIYLNRTCSYIHLFNKTELILDQSQLSKEFNIKVSTNVPIEKFENKPCLLTYYVLPVSF